MDGESYHQTCQNSNTFNILYYNCRSLLPKIDYLRAVTFSDHPDVICLVETWLSPDILDNELYIPDYCLIRLDRNRHGGGVALFLHKSITHSILVSGPLGLEFVLVTLVRHNLHLNLGIFYRPPSSHSSIFDTLTDVIISLGHSITSNLLIVGDFNISFTPTHYLYAHLVEFLCNFSLTQLVKSPTHFLMLVPHQLLT